MTSEDSSLQPVPPEDAAALAAAMATRGLPYSLLGVSVGPLSEEQQLKRSGSTTTFCEPPDQTPAGRPGEGRT
jgi:hypothetical protein